MGIARAETCFCMCNSCEGVTRLHGHVYYNNGKATWLLVTKKGAIKRVEELFSKRELNSHEASKVTREIYASDLPTESDWLEKKCAEYISSIIMYKEELASLNGPEPESEVKPKARILMFENAVPPERNKFN